WRTRARALAGTGSFGKKPSPMTSPSSRGRTFHTRKWRRSGNFSTQRRRRSANDRRVGPREPGPNRVAENERSGAGEECDDGQRSAVHFTPSIRGLKSWLGSQAQHALPNVFWSLCTRLCCKTIFRIRARKIDSRSRVNAQHRFKNSFAPIRLLRISIPQLLRGDFCNTIGGTADMRQRPPKRREGPQRL